MRRKGKHWVTHQLRRALFQFAQAPEAELRPPAPASPEIDEAGRAPAMARADITIGDAASETGAGEPPAP